MPTLKGAFLQFDAGLLGKLPNIIVFQFNPESVTRTPSLSQPPNPPEGVSSPTGRETLGDPMESISFTLRLDATDQLEEKNPIAFANGVLPALSALELLMYPEKAISLNLLGGGGTHRQRPNKVPVVLFFWGAHRLYPVKITNLSIEETEYDATLNPVRALVTVSLDMLTPQDLERGSLGQRAYDYTQSVKQVMAALQLANSAELGVNQIPAF